MKGFYSENFNSENTSDYDVIVAPYYNAINPTAITFEKEKIIATVDSLGHIEFFNMDETSLGFVDFPVSDNPTEMGHSAQYGKVYYTVKDNCIWFKMPIYDWEDYYPHCDGEYDRWKRFEIGHFFVVFDCNTHKIRIVDGK